MADSTRSQAEPDASSWRDVTVEQFRRYNLVSTALGVVVFGLGLGLILIIPQGSLFLPFQFVWGLALIVLGSVVGLWTAALRVDGMPAMLATKRATVRPDVERWSPRVVHFYTRENCSLCDAARARLVHDLEDTGIQVVDHDVDRDPVLQRRYGDRVPVAVHEGGELFALEYDATTVAMVRDARSPDPATRPRDRTSR